MTIDSGAVLGSIENS